MKLRTRRCKSPGQPNGLPHTQQAGLRVVEELAFGADYAETLRRWHRQFTQQHAQVLTQGFDAKFLRTWEFYLAYCEAAFDSGSIDVVQYTLVKN